MGNSRFGKQTFALILVLWGLLWGFPVHFFGLNSPERKS